MQEERRIAPEKRCFCIEKWPFLLKFEVISGSSAAGAFPILKNPHFLLENLHFLLKNVDFLSKNVDFITKTQPSSRPD